MTDPLVTEAKRLSQADPFLMSEADRAREVLAELVGRVEQAPDWGYVRRLESALEHYAAHGHWAEEPGDVYTTWGYDGGNELPWSVAEEAIASARPARIEAAGIFDNATGKAIYEEQQ